MLVGCLSIYPSIYLCSYLPIYLLIEKTIERYMGWLLYNYIILYINTVVYSASDPQLRLHSISQQSSNFFLRSGWTKWLRAGWALCPRCATGPSRFRFFLAPPPHEMLHDAIGLHASRYISIYIYTLCICLRMLANVQILYIYFFMFARVCVCVL